MANHETFTLDMLVSPHGIPSAWAVAHRRVPLAPRFVADGGPRAPERVAAV